MRRRWRLALSWENRKSRGAIWAKRCRWCGILRKAWPGVGQGTQSPSDGGRPHIQIETGAARLAGQVASSFVVCDSGCSPAGAGQSSGGGGARLSEVHARALLAVRLLTSVHTLGPLLLKERQKPPHQHHHLLPPHPPTHLHQRNFWKEFKV